MSTLPRAHTHCNRKPYDSFQLYTQRRSDEGSLPVTHLTNRRFRPRSTGNAHSRQPRRTPRRPIAASSPRPRMPTPPVHPNDSRAPPRVHRSDSRPSHTCHKASTHTPSPAHHSLTRLTHASAHKAGMRARDAPLSAHLAVLVDPPRPAVRPGPIHGGWAGPYARKRMPSRVKRAGVDGDRNLWDMRAYVGCLTAATSSVMPDSTGMPVAPENMTSARAWSASWIRSAAGVPRGFVLLATSPAPAPAARTHVQAGR